MNVTTIIKKTINEYLNETYKLTFKDKKEIEGIARSKYEDYIKDVEKNNEFITNSKRMIELVMKMVNDGVFSKEDAENFIKNNQLDFRSNLELKKPMLYNQFYKENFKEIKNEFIRYKTKNALSNYKGYTSKQKNKLKNIDYEDYYNSLSDQEKASIKMFLKLVSVRVNSGEGEAVDRKKVRDTFFRTPEIFQKMFSEKPSNHLWRGDYAHPCDEEYDHEDLDYLSMQLFSTQKKTAKEFGIAFNANNIKSYSGSFSLPLYIEYGGGALWFWR